MKKLSLFSLLWLTGLFTFFAAPIYAQDLADEIVDGAENIVNEAEDFVDETENFVDETEDFVNDVYDDYESLDYDWDMLDYNFDMPASDYSGISTWTMFLLWGLWIGMLILSVLMTQSTDIYIIIIFILLCMIFLNKFRLRRKN